MNTIATISGNKCYLSEITKIDSRIQLDFKRVYMIWYFLLILVVLQYHGKVLSVSVLISPRLASDFSRLSWSASHNGETCFDSQQNNQRP